MKLLALLFFSVQLHATTLVEDPENCLKKNIRPCAVKNSSAKPYSLQLENVDVSMSPQGVLWVDEGFIRLMRGESLLTVRQPQSFETAYAKLKIQDGIVLLRIFESMEVDMIDGSGHMWIKGEEQAQELVPGFHWNVGGVNRRGIASIEVPQSSLFKSVVRAWGALNFMEKSLFFEKVEAYRKVLVSAVGNSSALNQQLAQKMVEKDELERRNAARRKAQMEAENLELRKLYRQKNNMD